MRVGRLCVACWWLIRVVVITYFYSCGYRETFVQPSGVDFVEIGWKSIAGNRVDKIYNMCYIDTCVTYRCLYRFANSRSALG